MGQNGYFFLIEDGASLAKTRASLPAFIIFFVVD